MFNFGCVEDFLTRYSLVRATRLGVTAALLNRLIRRRSQKTSKLHVTGLCEGNSSVTGVFPAQRTRNAENVFIWWRHHVTSNRKCSVAFTWEQFHEKSWWAQSVTRVQGLHFKKHYHIAHRPMTWQIEAETKWPPFCRTHALLFNKRVRKCISLRTFFTSTDYDYEWKPYLSSQVHVLYFFAKTISALFTTNCFNIATRLSDPLNIYARVCPTNSQFNIILPKAISDNGALKWRMRASW